jgi:hypothetical protein
VLNAIFIPTIVEVNAVPELVTVVPDTVTVVDVEVDVVYAIVISILPDVMVPVARRLYLKTLAKVEPNPSIT